MTDPERRTGWSWLALVGLAIMLVVFPFVCGAMWGRTSTSPKPRLWSPRVYVQGKWKALEDQETRDMALSVIAAEDGVEDARILGPLGPERLDPVPRSPKRGDK